MLTCLTNPFSPSVTDLEQRSVQVSVARLRQSAGITGRDETSHSRSAPGVSFFGHGLEIIDPAK